MAVSKQLKPSGYEYCVVDYLWFRDLDHRVPQEKLKHQMVEASCTIFSPTL